MEVWFGDDEWSDEEEDVSPVLVPGLLPVPDLSPFQDRQFQDTPELLVSPAPRSAVQEQSEKPPCRTVPTLASMCSRKLVGLLKSEAQSRHNAERPHTSSVASLSQTARGPMLGSLLASCCATGGQLDQLATGQHQLIDFSEQVMLPAISMARAIQGAHETLVSLKLDGLNSLAELVQGIEGSTVFPRLSLLSCTGIRFSAEVDAAVGQLVAMAPSLVSCRLSNARGVHVTDFLARTLQALRCSRNLRQIDLKCSQGFNWEDFSAVLENCPISFLDLGECPEFVDNACLTSIASTLSDQLQDLRISGCFKVTDEGLQALSHHCKRLRSLAIKDCFDVTSVGVVHIARECSRLQEISMDGCYEVEDEALVALSRHDVRTSLEVVSFGDCTRITGEGIRALALGCPNLRDIDLLHVMSVGEDPLQCLSENCPNLRYLRYKGPETTVDKQLLQATVSRIPGVEFLAIQDAKFVDDNCLSVISKTWSDSLRTLTLTHCPALSYDSLRCLATCRQLTAINFSGCNALDNSGLRKLAKAADQLETVNLSGIVALSNKTLECFAANCPRLKSVNLYGCSKLRPHSLSSLAHGCENLRRLRTGPCQADDDSVVALCHNCVLMQDLCITGGLSLSDQAFTRAVQLIPRLYSLSLTDCALLTSESIRAIGKYSPLLTSLLLVACPGLDRDIFQYLRGCKKLAKLFLGEGLGFDPDDSRLAAFVSAMPAVSVIGPGIALGTK